MMPAEIKGKKMKKIILVATMLAFSTSAFAANTPAPTATKAPKAKVVHSACDPVKNPTACKSTVHHKAPKKKKK
jgi:uncharacterized protein YdeI (BOF family)